MKASEIALLLPHIFQRTLPDQQATMQESQGNVLLALLNVMDSQQAPVETTLAELHRYFLPDQTDDRFLPFLARWLDLEWLVDAWENPGVREMSTLRRLLPQAARLSTLRGTRQGMLRFLRLVTGLSGFQIEEHPDQAYHIVVTYPTRADRDLIAAIVSQMKPAHVTFELRESTNALPRSGETP